MIVNYPEIDFSDIVTNIQNVSPFLLNILRQGALYTGNSTVPVVLDAVDNLSEK